MSSIEPLALGASHLLAPWWPEDHPLVQLTQTTRRWNHPVSPSEGRAIAGAALTAFLSEKAALLNLPTDLSRYGLSYVKAGAYSQIRRLLIDGAPTAWMVELPADLDSRTDVIAQNHTNFAHFHERNRARFVPEPLFLYRSEGAPEGPSNPYAVSVHQFFEGYEELNFGMGTLRRWDVTDRENPMIPLPAAIVPETLAAMVAIIVYHFELDEANPAQGTSITGIQINRGDFIYRSRSDGAPDLHLITVRSREEGVSIPLFVLSLIQMAAAEEMIPDRDKVGSTLGFRVEVPVLVSNPSVAFHGIHRGLTFAFQDAGDSDAEAENRALVETRRWLELFAASEIGTSYQPWVEAYLAGELPLTFGNDAGEGQPNPDTLRSIHEQFVNFEQEGQDLGDANAFSLTLAHLRDRLPSA
jgi:hypothetical protein